MATPLRLNCWVLGKDSDSNRIFPVKVEVDRNNVGDLKKAIKEEKKRAFNHINADSLHTYR